MANRKQAARLRALVRQMQAVLWARRMARQTFPPLMAAVLDTRLRLAGAWIVGEMRRVEMGTKGDAA